MLFEARGDASFSLIFCPHPRLYQKGYPTDKLLAYLEEQQSVREGLRIVYPESEALSLVLDLATME